MFRLPLPLMARLRALCAPAAAACLAVLLAGLAGCAPAPAPLQLQGESMGSVWTVKLAAPAERAARLQAGIQARLDRVVAQMSPWEPDSSLSRFNAAPAGHRQMLEEEFATVLAYALALARDTDGAYDPSIGPLVNLWGFGPDGPRTVPDDAAIAAARARVGWQRLSFDAATRTLEQPGGAYLDLSSIATGFGVDEVARYLESEGVHDYLIELGGELRAAGHRLDGQPWRIGIERPDADSAEGAPFLATLVLQDQAAGSSGDFRNFFEQAGRRYSHHIDPRTGRPVSSRLASVTVLHAECMQADALAMAITALGPERGLAWAEARGLAALLVLREDEGFVERMTPAFREALAR